MLELAHSVFNAVTGVSEEREEARDLQSLGSVFCFRVPDRFCWDSPPESC